MWRNCGRAKAWRGPSGWCENRKPLGGVLRRFQAPFSCRPTTGHARRQNRAPNAAVRPCGAISRSPDIPPTRRARNPARKHTTPRAAWSNAARTRPTAAHPAPGTRPETRKGPAAARAAQREPESRESRKVDRESRKPPEKSRKSLVFSKSEVVTNAEIPLRAAVSDSKGHFSSKS